MTVKVVLLTILWLKTVDGLPLEDCKCASDEYCSDGWCVQCFPCELYRRQTSPSTCARDIHQCGSCIHGYKADEWTGGRESDFCYAQDGGSAEGSWEPDTSLIISFVAIAVVLLAVGAVLATYFNKQRRRTGPSRQVDGDWNSNWIGCDLDEAKTQIVGTASGTRTTSSGSSVSSATSTLPDTSQLPEDQVPWIPPRVADTPRTRTQSELSSGSSVRSATSTVPDTSQLPEDQTPWIPPRDSS